MSSPDIRADLDAALRELDRAASFETVECSECGAPVEEQHDEDCDFAPLNGIAEATAYIEHARALLDQPASKPDDAGEACFFDPYYCRTHDSDRHSVIDSRCEARLTNPEDRPR